LLLSRSEKTNEKPFSQHVDKSLATVN
jgi:hypothetical protein